MKKFFLLFCFFLLVIQALPAVSQSNYLYRQRLNWVKISKANPKEVPLGSLKHPYQALSVEQMEAMLLSVKLSKKHLLKHELSTLDVFNSWEARRIAVYIVDALAKVDADHVVNFSVIHKRPVFILRNDRLSVGDVWAAEDGLHIQFEKLFAKIEGD